MIILKIIFGIVIVCVVASALLGLLGAVIGLTFGIFGALIGICMKLVFSPVTWIALLIYLFYKYTRRHSA